MQNQASNNSRKKLMGALVILIIATSLITFLAFFSAAEPSQGQNDVLGVTISPSGGSFKLCVGDSKTFTAQALNGTAPYDCTWTLEPTGSFSLSINGEIICLQKATNIEVSGQNLTLSFSSAVEDDFVSISASVSDANGLVGKSHSIIVADPYSSPVLKFDASVTSADYVIQSDGKGWYRSINAATAGIIEARTSFSQVANNLFENLASNREWSPLIVFDGNFTVDHTITIPPYVEIKLHGKVTAANNLNADMFVTNSTLKNDYISISGGIWDGNRANNDIGSVFHFYGWHFSRLTDFQINNAVTGITTEYGAQSSWDDFIEKGYICGFENVGLNATRLSDSFITDLNIGTGQGGTACMLWGAGSTDLRVNKLHLWASTNPVTLGLNMSGSGGLFENIFVEDDALQNGTFIYNLGNTIIGATHSSTQGSGIIIMAGASNILVQDNYSHDNKQYGLLNLGARTKVFGGLYNNNGYDGIKFYSFSSTSFAGSQISNVEVLKNSRAANGTYNGLTIENANRILISNVYAWDYPSIYQNYGITEVGSSNYNQYANCAVKGNNQPTLNIVGSGSKYTNCLQNDVLKT